MVPDISPRFLVARRGKYFLCINPTMGTGIAMGVQTSFSDTANVLGIIQTPTNYFYPDFLRLICTAAGTGTTQSDLAIVTDSTSRYSSGGTAITKVNALEGSPLATAMGCFFGAVTAAAASGAKRVVSRMRLKTQAAPCWTVGDQVLIKFGQETSVGAQATDGATPKVFCFDAPPLVVSPSGSLLFHMWNTANVTTPPSWEMELGGWLE